MHPLQVSHLWPHYLKRQKKHHQGGKWHLNVVIMGLVAKNRWW